ncbi:MAG: hypothetical protein HOO87_15385 [Methyloglobulus sp.]|nr:hypothetical protein [Methyloglobulus sp.]
MTTGDCQSVAELLLAPAQLRLATEDGRSGVAVHDFLENSLPVTLSLFPPCLDRVNPCNAWQVALSLKPTSAVICCCGGPFFRRFP